MKTSGLISLVTISWVAATSSVAMVVRSQINIPNLAIPGPSLPSQIDMPVIYHANNTTGRRQIIEASVSDTQNCDIGSAAEDSSRDDKKATDAQLINLALTFQLLELAFYERGLSRYSKEDFKNAGYPNWVRGRFEQILGHKKTHVQFLEDALTADSAQHVKPCEYVFNDKSPREFVDFSGTLETIGTSAYTGAIQYISNDAYTTTAASILAAEARHASWINSAVRKQNPWNTAFETPLTINQVYTIATSFIKPESCPSSNYPLLSHTLHAYPQLTLSPKLIPGHEAQLFFSPEPPLEHGQEHLYAAFLSGATTIFSPLNKKEEIYFVNIPEDLKAAGTVFVVIFKGGEDIKDESAMLIDENIVAGPAIAVFPFDSRGRYPSNARKEKKKKHHS